MMEECVDDEAFVLELTSDSELSDNEKNSFCLWRLPKPYRNSLCFVYVRAPIAGKLLGKPNKYQYIV